MIVFDRQKIILAVVGAVHRVEAGDEVADRRRKDRVGSFVLRNRCEKSTVGTEAGAETESFGAEALPHAAASAKQPMTIPIKTRRKSGLFIL